MSEYYGVSTPTDDFLAHYGIKGMKWGVRKAIEKGNQKALARQYKKAVKKLAKLNKRADIGLQEQKANKYNKIAKISGKVGATGAGLAIAGTGTNHTLQYIHGLHRQIKDYKLDNIDKEMGRVNDDAIGMMTHNNSQFNKGKITEAEHKKNFDVIDEYRNDKMNKLDNEWYKTYDNFNESGHRRKTAADIGKYVGYAGAGIGALGLGTAAVSKIKAHAAKKRTTPEGHAKAVAERNAWQKEMRSAFKGTKYANMPRLQKKKRRS